MSDDNKSKPKVIVLPKVDKKRIEKFSKTPKGDPKNKK
jgi:hypothetical protein